MKILKLLNKKSLSIFFFLLVIFSTNLRSEEEPVDIWDLEKKVEENNSNEITVDLAINPGNSGGPIVNEKGQLVAVAVAGMSKEITEGISFGIKSSAVTNFLKTNKISPETNFTSFSMNVEKVNQLLEESTVYIFCE